MQGVWEENCDEGERALEKMRAEIKGCGASIGERVTNEISESLIKSKPPAQTESRIIIMNPN